jgi:hypothetical protein
MPTVIDKFDNTVELAYAGYPDRIFVVDTDGTINFKTQPGPSGYRPAEARAALATLLN